MEKCILLFVYSTLLYITLRYATLLLLYAAGRVNASGAIRAAIFGGVDIIFSVDSAGVSGHFTCMQMYLSHA